MITIITLFSVFFIFRLGSLLYSIKNENNLKKEGGIEYGKINSSLMAILHTIYYIAALTEAILKSTAFNKISAIGSLVLIFSFLVLIYVIYQLRKIWTVKLIIATNHKINTSFLFKYIRHPNYFLNIIPELAGIGMLCHAWHVMVILIPLYMVTLIVRIVQEEKVMKMKFPNKV